MEKHLLFYCFHLIPFGYLLFRSVMSEKKISSKSSSSSSSSSSSASQAPPPELSGDPPGPPDEARLTIFQKKNRRALAELLSEYKRDNKARIKKEGVYYHQFVAKREDGSPLYPDVTPCFPSTISDGRWVRHSKKIVYGHVLSAILKFGERRLSTHVQNKKQNDELVSHLCGEKTCNNPHHLVLEPKSVNDDRCHCHVFLQKYAAVAGDYAAALRLRDTVCDHEPKCWGSHITEYQHSSITGTVEKIRNAQNNLRKGPSPTSELVIKDKRNRDRDDSEDEPSSKRQRVY